MKINMARRQIEKDLCKEIKDSSFNFIPRGYINIETIYELVQQNYPNLCDDDYLCSIHCEGGTNQAEWKHGVRTVLNQLKSINGTVRHSGSRGVWIFF